jgi:hypothetical protein
MMAARGKSGSGLRGWMGALALAVLWAAMQAKIVDR